MILLNKIFNDLDRARLDAIFEEYRKINMGIDERVKMVDTLNNISLLIMAGYLTVLGSVGRFLYEPAQNNLYEAVKINGVIALGVIVMQYLIILQILRNDYLMLNLVEYYYIDMRRRVDDLLLIDDTSIWGYESYKYSTMGKSKLDTIVFNLLTLTRYGIPFISCIFVGVQFYISNRELFNSNYKFILFLAVIAGIFILILFILMIRWAIYSVERSKQLKHIKADYRV